MITFIYIISLYAYKFKESKNNKTKFSKSVQKKQFVTTHMEILQVLSRKIVSNIILKRFCILYFNGNQ